jgi:hypothetical protein
MTDKCPFDKTPEEIFTKKIVYTPEEKPQYTSIGDFEESNESVEEIEIKLYGVCPKCVRSAES